MPRDIVHEPDSRRFVVEVEGQAAYLVYRDGVDGVYDFASTYVPSALRGRGIGERIVRHALDHAREHGWKVIPNCWFVRDFIERNPEYEELVGG